MFPGVYKILVTLALSVVITGCKLTVIVGEGGTVESASTTRNCAAGSTCEFEVSEANFTETFTAVPLPGYKFKGWQSGAGFLCWNNKGPTCALSNTVFKDVPAIQSILKSDAVFSVRPVFSSIANAKRVAKDAAGRVLGEVMALKNGTDAAVRQVYKDKKGKEHGYMVEVNRMYISDTYGYTVYWLNANCAGKLVYVPSPAVLEPLFSNRYMVARKEKNQHDTLFFLELAPPKDAKLLTDTYAMEDGVCKAIATKLPLVKATILEEDYVSRYSPPFGVDIE